MICLQDSGKGGVGKTLWSMIAMHYAISRNLRPLLVETDDTNQEVYKSYSGKRCDVCAHDIDNAVGWGKVFTAIGEALEADPHAFIVVNMGARNRKSIEGYGELFNQFPGVFTFWVIDEMKDGLLSLAEYLNFVKQKICVVKNGGVHKVKEQDFAFNETGFANGMPSVYLSEAPPATVNALYSGRKAIHELLEDKEVLSFGDRLMATSWINKADSIFADAVDRAVFYESSRKDS